MTPTEDFVAWLNTKTHCTVSEIFPDIVEKFVSAKLEIPQLEYYMKVDACKAESSDAPDCVCWHAADVKPPKFAPSSWRIAKNKEPEKLYRRFYVYTGI